MEDHTIAAIFGAVGILLSSVVFPFALKFWNDARKARADLEAQRATATAAREAAEEASYMRGHEEARQQLRDINADLRKQVDRQDSFITTLQKDAADCHRDNAEMRVCIHYMRQAMRDHGMDPGPDPRFTADGPQASPDFLARQSEADHKTMREITKKIDEKQAGLENGGKS